MKVNGVNLSKYPSTKTFTSGETVSLEATAAPGYAFVNWSGDVESAATPTNVVLDCNKKVTAHFSKTVPNLWFIIGIPICVVIIISLAIRYIVKYICHLKMADSDIPD